MAPAISVCIPAYEMGGDGARFLSDLLERLIKQSFQDFEVVVSDQSDGDGVAGVCERYSGQLSIRHAWNRDGKRQASTNVNNAIEHADGGILKVLFQDDFLCSDNALQLTFDAFGSSEAQWLLCGSGVCRDGKTVERPMVPYLTPKMHFGKNTVSSPSVLAFRRTCRDRFDEELIWLMDVEMYKRLWDTHGAPVIVPDTLVANRLHDGQVSAGVSKSLRQKELRYVRRKFAGSTTMQGYLEYLRQRLKAI